MSADVFVVTVGKGCYRHLWGRDQGCCLIYHIAQDGLPQQRVAQPQVSMKSRLAVLLPQTQTKDSQSLVLYKVKQHLKNQGLD